MGWSPRDGISALIRGHVVRLRPVRTQRKVAVLSQDEGAHQNLPSCSHSGLGLQPPEL